MPMMTLRSIYIFLSTTGLFVLAVLPTLVYAQRTDEFVPLVGIPGVTNNEDVGSYLNALFLLSISIAALLAVIKLVIAGAKYMLSDVVSNKQSAVADIKGALFGLLIIAAAILILTTINPRIAEFEIDFSYEIAGQENEPPEREPIVTETYDCSEPESFVDLAGDLCLEARTQCIVDGGRYVAGSARASGNLSIECIFGGPAVGR